MSLPGACCCTAAARDALLLETAPVILWLASGAQRGSWHTSRQPAHRCRRRCTGTRHLATARALGEGTYVVLELRGHTNLVYK